jgi:hypothetical protein
VYYSTIKINREIVHLVGFTIEEKDISACIIGQANLRPFGNMLKSGA